jgi:hypothetical protein
MSEMNVHQKKKLILQQINFLWHNPGLSESQRQEVLELLERVEATLLSALQKDD